MVSKQKIMFDLIDRHIKDILPLKKSHNRLSI